MPQSASKDGRSRNFATMVYPESAPAEWIRILEDEKIAALISPLHDSDFDRDGVQKKPHFHVLIKFAGKKSPEQVKTIFDKIGGVGCETVNSFKHYARYLCHLDNPDKARYETDNVTALNGVDYLEEIGNPTDRYKAIREIMHYCRDNNVYDFAQLLDYCEEEKEEWFRVLCDNSTYVIKEYLKSRSWAAGKTKEQ